MMLLENQIREIDTEFPAMPNTPKIMICDKHKNRKRYCENEEVDVDKSYKHFIRRISDVKPARAMFILGLNPSPIITGVKTKPRIPMIPTEIACT